MKILMKNLIFFLSLVFIIGCNGSKKPEKAEEKPKKVEIERVFVKKTAPANSNVFNMEKKQKQKKRRRGFAAGNKMKIKNYTDYSSSDRSEFEKDLRKVELCYESGNYIQALRIINLLLSLEVKDAALKMELEYMAAEIHAKTNNEVMHSRKMDTFLATMKTLGHDDKYRKKVRNGIIVKNIIKKTVVDDKNFDLPERYIENNPDGTEDDKQVKQD